MNSLIHGFGSGFGRAIGRFMAFLVLGLIVIKILDVFNVDISKFTKFLYIDVKAASSDTWTEKLDLTDTHLYEGDMYSYIEFCDNYNQNNCAIAGRNVQTDFGWTGFTVNFNTNYLRVYNNHVILKSSKKYRLVIQQTGNTWTPVNSRYFITLNSIGGSNLYSSNNVYSNPDNTIFIEFTPLNNNDILDLYIRTTVAPNYFWLASGTKNFTVVRLDELVSESTDNSQEIIDNATQNTQDIINNQNSNTQDIINNQNSNTEKEIESQKVCTTKNSKSFSMTNGYLRNNGTIGESSIFGYSDYIPVSSLVVTNAGYGGAIYSCFYREDKSLINCVANEHFILGPYSLPNNSYYFRFSYYYDQQKPQFEITSCVNGNQAINDLIGSNNVNSDTGTSFFNDFEDDDFGLSEIITLPLTVIQQLTSKTCLPLNVPVPYTNKNIILPCMTEIYQSKVPTIYNVWKVVSFGIIAYFIAVDIFHLVKGFKDPESDKVEVLDL